MDYGNNTYLEIKKSYQRDSIMIAVLNAVIGVMFLSTFAKTKTPVDKYELYFMVMFGGVFVFFILYGVIGVVIRNARWKKMLQTLGCMSDEDAQWMMSHAKPLYSPLSPYIVPRYYIKDDMIINFESVKTYEIRKISLIKKRDNINFKNGCIIDIKINGSPYHDKIAMRNREERDMIYNNMVSIFERYGGDSRKF